MLFNHNGEEQFTEAWRIAKPWEIIHDSVFFKQLSLSGSPLVSGDLLTFADWPGLWLINPLSYILNGNHWYLGILLALWGGDKQVPLLFLSEFSLFPTLFLRQCFSFLSFEPEQKWEVVRLRPQFFDVSFWRTADCRKKRCRDVNWPSRVGADLSQVW